MRRRKSIWKCLMDPAEWHINYNETTDVLVSFLSTAGCIFHLTFPTDRSSSFAAYLFGWICSIKRGMNTHNWSFPSIEAIGEGIFHFPSNAILKCCIKNAQIFVNAVYMKEMSVGAFWWNETSWSLTWSISGALESREQSLLNIPRSSNISTSFVGSFLSWKLHAFHP